MRNRFWGNFLCCLFAASFCPCPQLQAQVITLKPFADPNNDPTNTLAGLGAIGFTYAGTKFVGSVYGAAGTIGKTNSQLYSTGLTGGTITLFGPAVLDGSNFEHYVASSYGKGGFPMNDIYVGDDTTTSNFIVHMPKDGSSSDTFVTLPPPIFNSDGTVKDSGHVRGILFDVVGTFGHNMLVSTTSGRIYLVECDTSSPNGCSKGKAQILVEVLDEACNTCFEGMVVIPTNVTFGNPSLAGQLIVVSETSGKVRAISPTCRTTPTCTPTVLNTDLIPNAEVVDFVPLDFGLNSDPVQGFYEAVYHPGKTGNGLFKADAGQFRSPTCGSASTGCLGDLLVTQESSGVLPCVSGGPVLPHIIDIHWDGSKFIQKCIGDIMSGNPEDGLLVTPDRIGDRGFLEVCKSSSLTRAII